MTWVPGPPQAVVRHILAEAIREALTTKEPIGDAAVQYNVVEALNRVADSITRLSISIDAYAKGQWPDPEQ